MIWVPDRDYGNRFVLRALHGPKQCWVVPTWGGQTKDLWWTLPDGSDVTDIIASGNWASLPKPTLHVENTGTLRDMLHNTGMAPAVVSDKFVEVVRASHISGLSFVPAQIVPKRGKPFDGYSLAFHNNADEDDVRGFPNWRNTALMDVRAGVLTALTDAGVSGFHVQAAEDAAEALRNVPD